MQSVHQESTRIRGSWRALHLSPQKEFYTFPRSLAVQKRSEFSKRQLHRSKFTYNLAHILGRTWFHRASGILYT